MDILEHSFHLPALLEEPTEESESVRGGVGGKKKRIAEADKTCEAGPSLFDPHVESVS